MEQLKAGDVVEVLWDVASEVDPDMSAALWWPCRLLRPCKVTLPDNMVENNGDNEEVDGWECMYDYVEQYPEYTTEEELATCLVFVTSHNAWCYETTSDHFYRVSGSTWQPIGSVSSADLDNEVKQRTIEHAEHVLQRTVQELLGPFFQGKDDHAAKHLVAQFSAAALVSLVCAHSPSPPWPADHLNSFGDK